MTQPNINDDSSNSSLEVQRNKPKRRNLNKLIRHENTSGLHMINQSNIMPPGTNKQDKQSRISPLKKKKGSKSPSNRKKPRVVNSKGDKKTRTSPSGSKHDMPMGKKDLYFALDCEMVGVGPHGAQSALARVSIVNWDSEVVLDTFVKVPVPVTDYRTFVSGIRSEDIESGNAMPLEKVRIIVKNILRGKILIGHALENDLKALNITHPWCDTRDTATFAPYMRENVDSQNRRFMFPRRLKDLAWEELGKKIQVLGVAHSSVEDGIAALELYKAIRPQWEASVAEQVKTANELESKLFQKTPNTMKRRVQPLPGMYRPFPPGQYHSRNLQPVLRTNLNMKEQQLIYYMPRQDPRLFPYTSQYTIPGPNQQKIMTSPPKWKHYIPTN